MEKPRPCTVECEDERYKGDIGHYVPVWKRALFHRFADSVGYAGEREVPITEAIVEFEDGQLEKVDPGLIKFDVPTSDSD